MAISNLNRIIQQKNMNFNVEKNDEKSLELIYNYMEESFNSIISILDTINKNQVFLLEKVNELKEKEE